jgi:hypothetical protein
MSRNKYTYELEAESDLKRLLAAVAVVQDHMEKGQLMEAAASAKCLLCTASVDLAQNLSSAHVEKRMNEFIASECR